MAENKFELAPQNYKDLIEMVDRLSKTEFIPVTFRNKPGEILAAIQYGSEVGLKPMQALQSIAVINGRPSIWGDAMLALIQASGLLEWIKETSSQDSATCEVKRKGDKEVCKVSFSHADAIKAGLANKQGPWTSYPKRMRQMRARGFALRDKFPDVLKGLISSEEARDYPSAVDIEVHETETHVEEMPDNVPQGSPKLSLKPEVMDDRHEAETIPEDHTDRLLTDEETTLMLSQARSLKIGAGAYANMLFEKFAVEDFSELKISQMPACTLALQAMAPKKDEAA